VGPITGNDEMNFQNIEENATHGYAPEGWVMEILEWYSLICGVILGYVVTGGDTDEDNDSWYTLMFTIGIEILLAITKTIFGLWLEPDTDVVWGEGFASSNNCVDPLWAGAVDTLFTTLLLTWELAFTKATGLDPGGYGRQITGKLIAPQISKSLRTKVTF
jgi:hypothetical protein